VHSISAVGFELLTNSGGVLFDNILVTNSEADAKNFALNTWAARYVALCIYVPLSLSPFLALALSLSLSRFLSLSLALSLAFLHLYMYSLSLLM